MNTNYYPNALRGWHRKTENLRSACLASIPNQTKILPLPEKKEKLS